MRRSLTLRAQRPPSDAGTGEWIAAGLFTADGQAALEGYDKVIGLGLEDLCVDGSIVKDPCGGQTAGPSPVDRGKHGTKRSVTTEGHGIPVGVVVALPIGMTRLCWNPLWRVWAGWTSIFPSASLYTWMPAATATGPVSCLMCWAVTLGSLPGVPRCRSAGAG